MAEKMDTNKQTEDYEGIFHKYVRKIKNEAITDTKTHSHIKRAWETRD